MNTINIPIECQLTEAETLDRVRMWRSVRQHVHSVVQFKNGIEAKVSTAAVPTMRDLAASESECCPSISFEIIESGADLTFKITSDNIDTVQGIHSLISVSND